MTVDPSFTTALATTEDNLMPILLYLPTRFLQCVINVPKRYDKVKQQNESNSRLWGLTTVAHLINKLTFFRVPMSVLSIDSKISLN